MSRRAVAVAVITVWLAAVAWLVRREIWRPRADVVARAALSLPPGAIYFAITLGDRQVGYASLTVDTLADTLRVSDLVALDVPVPGGAHRTEARTDVLLSRGFTLRAFTTIVRGDDGRFRVTGERDGDSVLAVRIAGSGAPVTRRLGLVRPLALPQVLALSVAMGGGLASGRSVTTRVLDPVLLSLREVSLTAAAETTLIVPDSAVFDSAVGRFVPVAFDTVVTRELRATEPIPGQRLWVDEDGLPVLVVSSSGLRIERSAFEVAYENFRRTQGRRPAWEGPLVRRTAVASGVAPAAGRLAMTVRLAGQPLEGLALDGDRQRLSGDTVTITREDPAALAGGYRLPSGRRELAAWVRPEPLIQSDDARLQAQARQIVGNARRSGDAAARLVEWVYRNVVKAAPASVPSALDVLETRSGDCNEHTVLLVALARAVGLPARSVAGVVYLDGAFYYHAWPEVYLDGWVAVDPTFGQFPADAAHLRLSSGGLARQLELARVIGGLTIEVLPAGPGG
jgi:transglutaminase-like putative cysteine protease